MKNCSPTGKLMDRALNKAVRKASPSHQWRAMGASMSTSRRRTTRFVMGEAGPGKNSGTMDSKVACGEFSFSSAVSQNAGYMADIELRNNRSRVLEGMAHAVSQKGYGDTTI